ncbi:MAG: PCP reductase family protein, partial [Rhodospirillaceae bacterium]|nr:PCP reductase family protein [Rhodospirillaceae bacterium]
TKTHTPNFDIVAEETISWSNEAEEMIGRAPSFVQGMARKSVLRFAQEKGHTFVTSDMVKEVMGMMMPGQGDDANDEPLVLVAWSDGARALLQTLEPHLANNISFRAEKRARRDGATLIMPEHVAPFLQEDDAIAKISWDAAALARLARVPEKMRERVKFHVEETAHEQGIQKVDFDMAEKVISDIRRTMCPVPEEG